MILYAAAVLLALAAFAAPTLDRPIAIYSQRVLESWEFLLSPVSLVGQPIVICGFLALGALLRNAQRYGERCCGVHGKGNDWVALLLSAGCAIGLSLAIKIVVGRARPMVGDLDPFAFAPFGMLENFNSMPSTQAATAVALAAHLGILKSKYSIPAYALAAVVCLERVIVVEHWTSDVLSGIALGLAIPVVLNKYLPPRKDATHWRPWLQ